jgi:hypothetical protein
MRSEADKLFIVIGYLEDQDPVSNMMALIVRDAVATIEELEKQISAAKELIEYKNKVITTLRDDPDSWIPEEPPTKETQ